MKRVLTLSLATILVLAPVSAVKAETLTRNDVVTVAPQLSSTLGNLSVGLSVMQRQQIDENAEISSYSSTLSAFAKEIAGGQLTQAQIDVMVGVMSNISSRLSAIASARIARQNALNGISTTLANVVTLLSQTR